MAQPQTSKRRIIVLVGPTASGKSALAVRLAKRFNGEIISADSRQVYRRLNIGTGKITKKEMQGVPHHLLDVVSAKKRFTANDFLIRARKAIADIERRGKLPIICGGTGFYIDALLGRIELADVQPDLLLRARLEKKSAVELYALLKRADRARAQTIDRHNKRRLIRALEITRGGAPRRVFKAPSYETLWIGLALPREQLRKKIRVRLTQRLQRGMLAEAKRLHTSGLSYKRMEDLGLEYRFMARHLHRELTRAELEVELEYAIWHYAKRQQSYWKRNKEITWYGPNDNSKLYEAVKSWLKRSF